MEMTDAAEALQLQLDEAFGWDFPTEDLRTLDDFAEELSSVMGTYGTDVVGAAAYKGREDVLLVAIDEGHSYLLREHLSCQSQRQRGSKETRKARDALYHLMVGHSSMEFAGADAGALASFQACLRLLTDAGGVDINRCLLASLSLFLSVCPQLILCLALSR
jgi:hypothetical protein